MTVSFSADAKEMLQRTGSVTVTLLEQRG